MGRAVSDDGGCADRPNGSRALEALEEMSARGVLEQAAQAILVTDLEERIVLANEAACRMLGYCPGELPGKSFLTLMAPADMEREVLRRAEPKPGGPSRHNVRVRSRDGSLRDVAISTGPLSVSGGRVVGAIRSLTETADPEETRRLLRAQRELAERVGSTAPVLILVSDTEGRLLQLNSYARELTGYAEQDLVDSHWREVLVPEGDRERIHRAFRGAADGRLEVCEAETALTTKAGRTLSVQWAISLLRGPDGNGAGILAVGQDVTELHRQRRLLRQRAGIETVGRLVDGIAHDFNNQLGVIRCYCDMLEKSLPDDHPMRRVVAEIQQACETSVGVSKQLLALTRPGPMKARAININRLIERRADEFRRMVSGDVKLSLSLADDLASVEADPVQMELIITNLIAHAGGAMSPVGELTIETANVDLDQGFAGPGTAGREASYVMLAITDTGSGDEPDSRTGPSLPLYAASRRDVGASQGLSLAHEFVRRHGGNICVTSQPGLGTTLAVYLPSVAAPAEDGQPAGAEGPAGRGAKTILVVEDDGQMREVVARVLRDEGYRVVVAEDGQVALELLHAYDGEPDLMITDIVMPGMSGGELARQVQVLCPTSQILYISGCPEHAIPRYGVPLTGGHLLRKPFRPASLTRMVRLLLGAAGGADKR